MFDRPVVSRATEVMVHRIATRLGPVTGEDPRILEGRLSALDGWTLETMLRATAAPAATDDGTEPRLGHLGVRGVDHALNRLVVDEPGPEGRSARRSDAIDVAALDDEDLIAASHYVPETLPGYVLG